MTQSSQHIQENINYSVWGLVKDLWSLMELRRGRFWLGTVARLFSDIVWLYPPYALASLVTFLTNYKSGDSLHQLWVIIGVWFLVVALRYLSMFVTKMAGNFLAEEVGVVATQHSLKHLFLLDMQWHERENSGNKIKRIDTASGGFNKILRMWFGNILEIAVNLIAISFIIAGFDKKILGALVVFFVAYFFLSRALSKRVVAAVRSVNPKAEEVGGILFESINNIRTVKVMGMTQALNAMFQKVNDGFLEKVYDRAFWWQFRQSFMTYLVRSFHIGMLAFIAHGVTQGHYELGFLILFHSYFSHIHASMEELSLISMEFVTSKVGIARMKAVLDEPITIDDETGKAALSPDWQTVRVQNLSFSYGDHEVLQNVSFEVKRGQKVGIVGLSGAGKSTLLKLLLKEREEFQGDIMFDDASIKSIRKTDYFKKVSVVLQDTEVFNFSLKENIVMGSDAGEGSDAVLKQALKTAHMEDLVKKLPEGLDTLIGEKGVKLSGGERQRLGIARAVFRQPEILLLDEATSHLDLESEEKIRESLHEFFENVTAIVIAHRLTTIKEMDTILVLENGSIVESGSFKELYKLKGRFYDLWEKQGL